MNIRDLKEQLYYLDDNDRDRFLTKLFKKFGVNSKQTIFEFQASWDGKNSYEHFKEKQNEVILFCLEMEMSKVGQDLRKLQNLQELKPETEL